MTREVESDFRRLVLFYVLEYTLCFISFTTIWLRSFTSTVVII